VTISGGKTFNGQSGLIEYFQDQTTTYSAPSTLALGGTIPTKTRFYSSENGTVETEYGGTIETGVTVSGITINTTATTTYTPPLADRRYTLAANTSDTTTSTMGVTSVTNFGATPATNTSVTTTIRYVGQESITVPAGTFTACKFMDTSNSETTEHWFAKGSGTPVRFTSRTSEGQTVTISLTGASRLNGAAIPAN
jgi:hypothetical protein